MGERARSIVTGRLLPRSFAGHPGLFFSCMARLLYLGHSADHDLPVGAVAMAHET